MHPENLHIWLPKQNLNMAVSKCYAMERWTLMGIYSKENDSQSVDWERGICVLQDWAPDRLANSKT